MATLVKKGNNWYIRIRLPGGKEKTISTKTGNKREAERRLRMIEDQEFLLKAGMITENQLENIDLKEARKRFEKYNKVKNLRPNTKKAYTYTLDYFFEAVSHQLPVKSLNESHIKAYVRLLHKKKFKPNSINLYIRHINSFTAWLKREKYTLAEMKHEKIRVDQAKPKFLTPDELDNIYKQCEKNPRLYSTLKVYEALGLRLSELHHSRREGDFIFIDAENAKGRKQREVPIPLDIIEHYDIAMNNLYHPDALSHMFKKVAKDAKVDPRKTFHSLRHTYALRMLMKTDNIYYVQQMLGHQNIETTMIYTQFSPELLRSVLKEKTQKQDPKSEAGAQA
ncbi:MAG: tyrosine-type recombinase/integrase [Calditrichaeota bacterium]|nr:tyrosine-type recombinase/integrase [Calditrichota bacterium]